MTKQNRNPKRAVALAAVFALLAVAAFAAVFWIYDGMAIVEDVLGFSFTQADDGGQSGSQNGGKPPAGSDDATASTDATDSAGTDDDAGGDANDDSDGNGSSTTTAEGLIIPDDMPEDFALRMWQEQIDSQRSIGRMVAGDFDRIVVTDVEYSDNESRLAVTAHFKGGGSADGFITMRRVGDNWFFTNLSGVSGEKPDTVSEVPDIADVSIEMLNAMIAEQIKSSAVLEEYATGDVEDISFGDIVEGPDTTTVNIIMNETHEQGLGEVVLVSQEVDGETVWFVTRFTKQ